MNANRAILAALVGTVWLSSNASHAQQPADATPPSAAASGEVGGASPAPATSPSALAPDASATPAAAPAPTAPSPVTPENTQPSAAVTVPDAAAAQASLDAEPAPAPLDSGERQVSNPKFGKPSVHDDVVGRWAMAYFGVRSVPIADPLDADRSVPTPVFGARHWFSDCVGLDAGLGFGYGITGGTSYVDGGTEVNLPQTGVFAVAAYAGLPLSLYDGGSFNALVIPELNVGFANGLEEAGVSATGEEEFPRGFVFGVGARAGAELHLDFIDLPQVALQLTFGFALKYTTRTLETESASGVVSGKTAGRVAIASDATSAKDWLAAGLQILWYL